MDKCSDNPLFPTRQAIGYRMSHLIHVFIISIQVLGVTPSVGPAYTHSTGRRTCLNSDGCWQNHGEVCWWFYDGCELGVCVCDPRRFTPGPDGTCLPIKWGDDTCTTDIVCPLGMNCQQGRCKCKLGSMTKDRRFCKQAYHRLLGEDCVPFDNTCVQQGVSGYVDTDVACDYRTGICKCVEGYKNDGISCRRRNIGEDGCKFNYHCHGGAICQVGSCTCPNGYTAVADNTKCAPLSAKANLHIGQECDETSEKLYCSYGLICHHCAGESKFKCLKYDAYGERTGGDAMQTSGVASRYISFIKSNKQIQVFCLLILVNHNIYF